MTREPEALALLLRQLAAAQRRGLPAGEVVGILAQDPAWSSRMRATLTRLAQHLGKLTSLSAGLHEAGVLPTRETADLLHQAEAQGVLSQALAALADDFDAQARDLRGLRMALTWPLMTSVLMATVYCMLAIFVVPAFQEAYASMNAELPTTTTAFFAVVGPLGRYAWVWLPLIALFAAAWYFDKLPVAVNRTLNAAVDHVGFVRRRDTSRFVMRLLAWTQLFIALPALRSASLAHLRATTPSQRLRTSLQRIDAALQAGSGLSLTMKNEAALPRRLSLLVELGERLDDLPAALSQLAEAAEIEAQQAAAQFERGCLLVVYGVLGVVAGVTLFATYLPIFKLGTIV